MSETDEFVQKLNALLKERDRARRAIFDLHMAVSKAEEIRGKAVESAHAAGGKILELQTELSALKTELGASVRILKESEALLGESVIRAEAAENRAIALQGVVERVREEISKAEVPETDLDDIVGDPTIPVITEEQLEATRKIVEGDIEPSIEGPHWLRDTFDEDDNEWDPVLHSFLHPTAMSRRERRSFSLARFDAKILGIGLSILAAVSAAFAFASVGTSAVFLFLPIFGVTVSLVVILIFRHAWTTRRSPPAVVSPPLAKPILRGHGEIPPAPSEAIGEIDALTQDDVEAIFGEPVEEAQDDK
jgi:hypothetical protein